MFIQGKVVPKGTPEELVHTTLTDALGQNELFNDGEYCCSSNFECQTSTEQFWNVDKPVVASKTDVTKLINE